MIENVWAEFAVRRIYFEKVRVCEAAWKRSGRWSMLKINRPIQTVYNVHYCSFIHGCILTVCFNQKLFLPMHNQIMFKINVQESTPSDWKWITPYPDLTTFWKYYLWHTYTECLKHPVFHKTCMTSSAELDTPISAWWTNQFIHSMAAALFTVNPSFFNVTKL